MAKLEKTINGDFNAVLNKVTAGILDGSYTASLEDSSDFVGEYSRCSVRVFERYSAMGSNRVSMSVTLFQEKGKPVQLSAITAGGSQAMFLKMNTWGEQAFLQTLEDIL